MLQDRAPAHADRPKLDNEVPREVVWLDPAPFLRHNRTRATSSTKELFRSADHGDLLYDERRLP